MTTLRSKAFSAALVFSLLALSGGPVFARGLSHPGCADKRHECASIPLLTQCCCGDHGDISNPPATTPERVNLAIGSTDCAFIAALFDNAVIVDLQGRVGHTRPTHDRLPDLPVLFRDLRL